MTKPTQDKETLREAVARAIGEAMGNSPHRWRHYLPAADAAIATMFKRLRTPSEGMLNSAMGNNGVGPHTAGVVWQAMLTAFQQENSDGR